MSLREQVEQLLPNWDRWYPSLFDAAQDLGLIRAEVCSPDALLLSNRHNRVRRAAEHAHREKWGGAPEDVKASSSKRRRPGPKGKRPLQSVR